MAHSLLTKVILSSQMIRLVVAAAVSVSDGRDRGGKAGRVLPWFPLVGREIDWEWRISDSQGTY